MVCWDKMIRPMREVWARVSERIGLRRNGHVKLHQDIQRCEYEDVHILWEMLKRNEMDLTRSKKRSPFSNFVQWAKHTPLISRAA